MQSNIPNPSTSQQRRTQQPSQLHPLKVASIPVGVQTQPQVQSSRSNRNQVLNSRPPTQTQQPHSTPNIKSSVQSRMMRMEPEEPLNEDEHHRPVYMQYSIRNGLYIRPNSPISQDQMSVQTHNINGQTVNTQRIMQRQMHQLPTTRINNTASSSFLVPQPSQIFEEEKQFDKGLPSPFEDYKQPLSNPYVTEEYESGFNKQESDQQRTTMLLPPPTTTNVYSPPVVMSPPSNDQASIRNHQLQYQPPSQSLVSAPNESINQSQMMWNPMNMPISEGGPDLSHQITAATTHTVGSTGAGTMMPNMTPSDMRSRHNGVFPGEQLNAQQQLICIQRPPPPSPFKTSEQNGSPPNEEDAYSHQQNLQESVNNRNHGQVVILNEMEMNNSHRSQSSMQSSSLQMSQSSIAVNSNIRSIAASVYHEVLANQQKSQELTLRGMEAAIDENQQLRARISQLEADMAQMRVKNVSLEQWITSHNQQCPLRKE